MTLITLVGTPNIDFTQDGNFNDAVLEIKRTLNEQGDALKKLSDDVDNYQYQETLKLLLECQGHIIVCGMGKSGHVGKKIAASFASTGTPSFFLHPAEAFHGDLGMITKDDIVILISNSGETDEVLQLIPSIKAFGNHIIAITGNQDSTLAKNATTTLLINIEKESCPNNLAPTVSTTATIAIGDALVVSLMKLRDFKAHDFAKFHPGGSLGRRLLTKVKDVMKSDNLPLVSANSLLCDIIVVMNEGRYGIGLVIENELLVGIITDGDLRRVMMEEQPFTLTACDIMTHNPKKCYETDMLSDAEQVMQENKISTVAVLNNKEQVSGLIQIYNI
ncbi:SIS domain-containing protein [Photobacterium sp. Alg240-V54]|uniref:KpsF/GutQ family sugar-phosphate isomerase n=1 Tax=Photobacterium sp. Alg240-V54 TaxID=2305995 RepID=UPI0013D585BB|nr:KpsF/GutQ family sugar-phosphate isomerase [Photobacterium sp. Alg240-V54]